MASSQLSMVIISDDDDDSEDGDFLVRQSLELR